MRKIKKKMNMLDGKVYNIKIIHESIGIIQ